MALGNNFSEKRSDEKKDSRNGEDFNRTPSAEPPVQLDLLPSVPVPRAHTSSQFRFPWLADNMVVSEPGSSEGAGKGLDVNRLPMIGTTEETEDGAALSSPNSTVSSFHMDFGVRRSKRDMEAIETERTSSRASDDEENGSTRKKLRLSKEQSAFLEESFKEHSTLNPVFKG
ncbi:hypothetical protein FEM48_Zijuj12G0084100 [Ziziphus jujuba var. spinosa]|uniref:HD-ZIP protein N-terminal domain-containing protein n=1 Tax=Ziziphus jujuba var. spinosa TaxID=714518 RepID=A0A978UC80_ZIZJJ|nr:hypothetical protein FEM48_Zijuj12G0084100 [Ziziphus jujuba var. spinosa]